MHVRVACKKRWDTLVMVRLQVITCCPPPLLLARHYLLTSGIDLLKICGEVESVFFKIIFASHLLISSFSTMADMMERNALVNAQGNASQVEMLVSQAIRASPRVQPVGRIDIARGFVVFSSCFFKIYYPLLISDLFSFP
jgi:stage V sporulation protein SpoVS